MSESAAEESAERRRQASGSAARGAQSMQTVLKGSKLVWLVCVCSGIGRGAKYLVETGASGKRLRSGDAAEGSTEQADGLEGGEPV